MSFSERTRVASTLAALAALVFTAAVTTPAGATPNFPAQVAAELDLGAAPPCSLCHEGATKLGTVITPFGTSMRGRGLVAYDEQSLVNALLALEGEATDSDGDGLGDIEELRQGGDPSVAEGGEAPIVAEYGCSAGPPSSSRPNAGTSLWALLTLLVIARRRALANPKDG